MAPLIFTTVNRRALCLLAAASVLPARRAFADGPGGLLQGGALVSNAAFSATLPPFFVQLSRGGVGGQNVLLMAGDFRATIRETGAATTISVLRAEGGPAAVSSDTDADGALAVARELARLRDAQTGLASGCPSAVVASTVTARDGTLGFEMLTPLSCVPGSSDLPPPSLLRHTAVRAVWPTGDGGGRASAPLVLFAGARQVEWDADRTGEALVAAADTFVLR